MTNYIEEMMRTAGVEPTITYFEAVNPLAKISSAELVTRKREFTTEKQLEVIKLILISDNIDYLNQYYSEILDCYVFECFSLPELRERSSWTTQNKYFELALAELVIMLMKAGELDKEKVKEILE